MYSSRLCISTPSMTSLKLRVQVARSVCLCCNHFVAECYAGSIGHAVTPSVLTSSRIPSTRRILSSLKRLHIFSRKLKVINTRILLNALRRHRLRQRHESLHTRISIKPSSRKSKTNSPSANSTSQAPDSASSPSSLPPSSTAHPQTY